MAQLSEAASKKVQFVFDSKRGASMIAFGAVYTGAFQAWWINYLLQNVNLADPLADAAVKTGLCQFGTIPLVYMLTFFLITGAVRGMDREASIANAKEQYFKIYSRNVGYWIPVQMCQFLFVPREWQIPFLCAGGFVWSVILSSLALQQAPLQVGADSKEDGGVGFGALSAGSAVSGRQASTSISGALESSAR